MGVKTKYQNQLRQKLRKAGQLGETGDGSVMERVYSKKIKKQANSHHILGGNKIVKRVELVNDNLTADQKDAIASTGKYAKGKISIPDRGRGENIPSYKKVNRIQNPLHKFNTQNAIFTLAALTLDEVNYPDENILKGKKPEFIVAKSGGGSSRDSALAKEPIQVEFYIDNVQIEAIIHSNSRTGHTQGTNISFMVHEPYSLGLFLQNLQRQVLLASGKSILDQSASYLTHPMVLICEFKGTTDEPLTKKEEIQLRKVMPIQLKKVNFASNNGVSQYEVEAIALNDVAFADQYATLPTDVELKGETVQEVLFSGEQSLSAILNNKKIELDKSKKGAQTKRKEKRENKGKSKKDSLQGVNAPRDYLFVFPQNVGFASKIINKGLQETPAVVDAVGDYDVEAGLSRPQQVPYAQRIKGIFGGLFTSNFDYSFESGFSGEQIKINEIGKSKMVVNYLQNAADTGKNFSDDKSNVNQYYDEKTKTYIKSSAKIDIKKKTISFKKGMHLTSVMEEIILLSEYGQNLAQRKKNAPDGMIQWFKIIPARYMFNDHWLQYRFNVYPEIVMFRIVPYNVPDDKFMAPDEVSRVGLLDDFIRKEYNILYKGTNKDVIDFNVEFNQAFYTATMNDYGNTSGDTQDNANSGVSTSKSTVGQSFSTSSYSANTINNQIAFTDPQNVQGGDIETVELRIARQFNKAILDSAVDLVKLDLNIVGDPYFLPQTGFGNYVGHSPDTTTEQFTDQDEAADFLRGVVLTKVSFRTPLDIGTNGTMLFNKDTISDTSTQVLGEFSGYYYPITVRSSFSGNKFTQEIEMIRNKTGVMDPNTNTGTNNESALSSTNDSNDAFAINDDFSGQGVSA